MGKPNNSYVSRIVDELHSAASFFDKLVSPFLWRSLRVKADKAAYSTIRQSTLCLGRIEQDKAKSIWIRQRGVSKAETKLRESRVQ